MIASKESDDDLSSLISGLTSVDSYTTRQILLDCELTVATFWEEERKAIQTMLLLATSSSSDDEDEDDEDGDENKNEVLPLSPPNHKPTNSTLIWTPKDTASLPASGNRRRRQVEGKNKKTSASKSVNASGSKSVSGDGATDLTTAMSLQSLQTDAAMEAETMAQQMQQILSDFSSGAGTDATTVTTTCTTSTNRATQQQGRPYRPSISHHQQ